MVLVSRSVAVVYLARGAEPDHLARISRFVQSYKTCSAGAPHKLYVIFKGFENASAEAIARERFGRVPFEKISTGDDSFDLGAYAEATSKISEDAICYLNTNAELVSDDWLLKLLVNLQQPFVGGVAATASYESLYDLSPSFPRFPNPHLRSNAIMLRREHSLEYFSSLRISSKLNAYLLESGPYSITRQILAKGMIPLLVGRDGRGYGVDWWPHSQTFRQGAQTNLLVHDNMTRLFETSTYVEKREQSLGSWGDLRNPVNLLSSGD